MSKQRVGVGLDILAVERGKRRHDELPGRVLLEIGEFALEARLCRRRQNMRVVDHAAGERGKRRRRPNGGDARQPDQRDGEGARSRPPDQNFTFGATCDSAVAVNSAIALLRE